ncbi:TPA: hypothetical protein DEP90_00255 [Patescibacteria group bacterium]|nr:hypothetical protein [Patescibacteria group bacterium]
MVFPTHERPSPEQITQDFLKKQEYKSMRGFKNHIIEMIRQRIDEAGGSIEKTSQGNLISSKDSKSEWTKTQIILKGLLGQSYDYQYLNCVKTAKGFDGWKSSMRFSFCDYDDSPKEEIISPIDIANNTEHFYVSIFVPKERFETAFPTYTQFPMDKIRNGSEWINANKQNIVKYVPEEEHVGYIVTLDLIKEGFLTTEATKGIEVDSKSNSK